MIGAFQLPEGLMDVSVAGILVLLILKSVFEFIGSKKNGKCSTPNSVSTCLLSADPIMQDHLTDFKVMTRRMGDVDGGIKEVSREIVIQTVILRELLMIAKDLKRMATKQ